MQFALRGCQFFQSLLFGGEIRLDVSMGRFNALVSKPQGNGGDIDSGLEQVHGGRVPDHVRSNPFGEEARAIGTGALDRLLKEMIETVRRMVGKANESVVASNSRNQRCRTRAV